MRSTRTLLIAAVVGVTVLVGSAAGAQTDAEQERDEVQDRQAAVAGDLDVLEASNAEIDAVLDGIDARLAAQQAAVDDAQATAAAAEEARQEAEDDLGTARADVAALEQAIAEMAVASFVHPPTVDLVQSLKALSLSDALLQKTYLDARAKRDVRLLDMLETAETEAEERARELDVAAAEAAEAVTASQEALDGLAVERTSQQAFAADLQQRIDSRLAEAAVLAELDADLAAQIQAEQAALIERIPPPPPEPEPVVPASAGPSGTTPTTTTATTSGGGGGSGPTATSPPATTPPTNPPTTSPPVTTPPNPSTPPLRTVQGITVHAEIADDVNALLNAARADGISLSGWGYRSSQSQIALRQAHCGPTYYDIWIKPASACSPPTAVPGRSLHEQGRAIDFTHNGSTITSRSSTAFRWLASHASSYGLFNLPSEPWHWSTSGG